MPRTNCSPYLYVGNSFCSQTLAQGSELGSTQKWMFPYRNIKSEDGPFPDRGQASLTDSTETWGGHGVTLFCEFQVCFYHLTFIK